MGLPHNLSGVMKRSADLLALATGAGALLSWTFGAWAWPLSGVLHFFEASFFVWFAGALFAWRRRRRGWVLAHTALSCSWLWCCAARMERTLDEPAARRADELRVCTLNAGNERAGLDELCAAIVALDADLLLLQELDQSHAAAIQALGDELAPYRELHPRGIRGKGVLSRFPLEQIRWTENGDKTTRLEGVVRTPRGAFAFVNVHSSATVAILGPWSDFDEQVRELATAARANLPVVIAGDFNLAASSALLAPLESAGFANAFSEHGVGLGLSFPIFLRYRGVPLPRCVRIDHVFTRGFECRRAELGPDAGSDHRPLVATLAFVRD